MNGKGVAKSVPVRALFGKYRLRASATSERKCHSDVKNPGSLYRIPTSPVTDARSFAGS